MKHWEKMTHECTVCSMSECVKQSIKPPLRRHLQTLNRVLNPIWSSQDGQISQTPPSPDLLHLLYFTLSFLRSLRGLGVSRVKLSGSVLESLWRGLCAVLCEIAQQQQQEKNLNYRQRDKIKQIILIHTVWKQSRHAKQFTLPFVLSSKNVSSESRLNLGSSGEKRTQGEINYITRLAQKTAVTAFSQAKLKRLKEYNNNNIHNKYSNE